MEEQLLTAGIDVGSGAVKVAVLRDRGVDGSDLLAHRVERIRRRETLQVTLDTIAAALDAAGLPVASESGIKAFWKSLRHF